MKNWSENKAGKTSNAVYLVLRDHGYIKVDRETGKVCIRALSLLKDRCYQEVERWFMGTYGNAYPVLMGELQNILMLNTGKNLERRPESAEEEKREKYVQQFIPRNLR